jgi:alkylation response protein AidB-like acyl-CoA dehydrogenase
MDFADADDVAVFDMVRRYSNEKLDPLAGHIDETEKFAGIHLEGLAELGVMGMNLPEKWGGPGVSAIALFLAVQALASACASTTSMVTAHYLATDALLIGGDDTIRSQYLPRAATGNLLGAFALTEPRAGSSPSDMSTRAERIGDGYRITGTKHFISNAAFADFMVVFAITDPTLGTRGISAFVIDKGIAGVAFGPNERTMGLRGGHVFEVSLDCEIGADKRLGAEGTGFRTAMKVLDNGRIEIAATCVGIAEAALMASTNWAKQRIVNKAPIADFQGIQWMLADMATQLEAARLLGMNAAKARASGMRFSQEAAMAKLFASEMAAKVTDLALQIHGGYGYTRDMPLERYVRDARIMRIYEGSSEVQRNIIARTVLG